MEKLKICLIMPNVFPVPATKGGAVETLMQNLLIENEKNYIIDFTCVSIYEEKAFKLSQNFKHTKFIYINVKKKNLDTDFKTEDDSFKNYMDEFYEKIKDLYFDFIVVEGGDILGYKYILKKFPKEKCVAHIHGRGCNFSEENKEYYGNFIGISKYVCKQLKKSGKIEDSKIKLLYNAIDTEKFNRTISSDEKKELRKKYGISENDNVVMFSGKICEKKGIRELVKAFKEIKNIEKTKLLIIGSSSYGEKSSKTEFEIELQDLIYSIKDKVIFTGYVDNNDLYKMYNISDIAVVPSIWEEPFGLVVVEAMSSKTPLIVTRSGGIPEIVDEKTAFIIEKDENLIKNMTEKIDYLISNPKLRETMGENAKIRAKKFDIKNYLINFNNIFLEIKSK